MTGGDSSFNVTASGGSDSYRPENNGGRDMANVESHASRYRHMRLLHHGRRLTLPIHTNGAPSVPIPEFEQINQKANLNGRKSL